MLERLVDYAVNHSLTPEPGFAARTIKWAIVFTRKGEYVNVVPLGEGKGRGFPQAPMLSQPELVGGKEPRCHFLADALSTVALHLKPDTAPKDKDRARRKQAFFLRMLKEADPVEPGLAMAAEALANPAILARLHRDLAEQKAKSTDLGTLVIGAEIPLEHDSWYDWWRQFRSGLTDKPSGKTGSAAAVRCLLSGETITPAKTHPKIRGLASVGGLPAGDVLVGFDKEAFQSYGLTQAANAPVSEEMATIYSEALNHLINHGSIRLVDAMAVYWYRDSLPSDGDDPLADFFDPEPLEQREGAANSRARELLNALREGSYPDLANNRYFTLLLSGAAGRVMVRDWQEGSFEDLLVRIDSWFEHLAIVGRDGRKARRPKFLAVAGGLVRDLKDFPAPLLQGLWRSALTGTAIPYNALALATNRTRMAAITDQPPNTARMGLIKAYHRRQGDTAVQANLNPDHPDPAYHCGRLLAVLAHLQRAALGDVGSGVVQRYYTSASQSPALVFGRLIANAKNHLNKLSSPLAYWFESRIAEVMAGLHDDMPQTLSLKRQSLFALGYYQQLAFLRTKASKDEKQGQVEGLTKALPVQGEDEPTH